MSLAASVALTEALIGPFSNGPPTPASIELRALLPSLPATLAAP